MTSLRGLTLVTLLVASVGSAEAGGSVSVRADVVPSARMHRSADGGPFSADQTIAFGTTYGIAVRATMDLTPNIAVGVAPRVVWGLTKGPFEEVGKQYDFLGLVDVHQTIASQTTIGAFATLGYSALTLQPDPRGPSLGFGARVERSFGAHLFASVEVGYQLAFMHGSQIQGASGIPSQEVDEADTTRFLHAGLGAGAHF